MVAPYAGAQSVQNGNKCPHGLPIGTCPICSGMGGGSMRKDRDKPRVPGEMSYNECMAEWVRIQAAKEAKIQAEIQRVENMQAQMAQHRALLGLDKVINKLDNFAQKLDNMPAIIAAPIKIIINVIVKPILNALTIIPKAINIIQMFFSNVGQFISSVAEKLSTVLGEIKNFIDAKITQPIKKTVKTILAFFTQGEDEENEEAEKIKSREIKKILKGLFRIRSKAQKEKDGEDEKN